MNYRKHTYLFVIYCTLLLLLASCSKSGPVVVNIKNSGEFTINAKPQSHLGDGYLIFLMNTNGNWKITKIENYKRPQQAKDQNLKFSRSPKNAPKRYYYNYVYGSGYKLDVDSNTEVLYYNPVAKYIQPYFEQYNLVYQNIYNCPPSNISGMHVLSSDYKTPCNSMLTKQTDYLLSEYMPDMNTIIEIINTTHLLEQVNVYAKRQKTKADQYAKMKLQKEESLYKI